MDGSEPPGLKARPSRPTSARIDDNSWVGTKRRTGANAARVLKTAGDAYASGPRQLVHVAGFADYGKVANDWQDVNPTHVKHAYGFGIRGGTDDKTYVRLDVARGGHGTRVFLKFTPSF